MLGNLVFAASILVGGNAMNQLQAATSCGPASPIFSDPVWSAMPAVVDIEREWPERAIRVHPDPTVRLRCSVAAEGKLERCRVLSEAPGDLGFGAAALTLSALYRLAPTTQARRTDGSSTTVQTACATIEYSETFSISGEPGVPPP